MAPHSLGACEPSKPKSYALAVSRACDAWTTTLAGDSSSREMPFRGVDASMRDERLHRRTRASIKAVERVLNQIDEPDFRGFCFVFRPDSGLCSGDPCEVGNALDPEWAISTRICNPGFLF